MAEPHSNPIPTEPEESGWLDDIVPEVPNLPKRADPNRHRDSKNPIVMVETAFLASAAGLLWLVNFYFPVGPLRLFFPFPIALVYLRSGKRAAWMAVLVSTLLLTVLMGPVRSLQFLIPSGFLGWMLGNFWQRGLGWTIATVLGTILTTIGDFFRIGLVSLLLGDDLWLYTTTQVTGLLEWLFDRLGILVQPSLTMVQIFAIVSIILKNVIYLWLVHVISWFLCNRIGESMPEPPKWVQALLDEN
ncbi:MAG: DUF2232 domain-containing protein [Synechococcales bacterium]|nr:DUF2232 domain-containing protein [Synechococcales bacterium]